MSKRGLNKFIELLDREGELYRVKEFVDPELEIAEVTDRISKQEGGGKAILFENTGTDFPVLMNSMGSEKRIALALNANSVDEVSQKVKDLFELYPFPKGIMAKFKMLPKLKNVMTSFPRNKRGRGICQEVINNNPDLTKLPILKCWPYDGGRFITLPMVITQDPETGVRNTGMYRMQMFNSNTTGMHWHLHKTGAQHYEKYKKLGKKMPIAVALGDMAYTYSATAPLPPGIDEFILAGFMKGKGTRFVKCISQDMYVPADADIIIEGYVDPAEEKVVEGPFGDHTGFYSLADNYPQFHVTCITHKKNAVYPATIVGVPPQEDAYIGLATEKIFLAPLKYTMQPELESMHMPVAATLHNVAILKSENKFRGQALKTMNALWGAGQLMFAKMFVILNEDIELTDYRKLAEIIANNYDPISDTIFSKGPLDVLEHATDELAFGGKMGLDVTNKVGRPELVIQNAKHYEAILNQNGVERINTSLIVEQLPVIYIFAKQDEDVLALGKKLTEDGLLEGCKFVVFVDEDVIAMDTYYLFWVTVSNIDPVRDTVITGVKNNSHIVIDARRKHKDGEFQRDWPEVVVSETETIEAIDKKWDSLGFDSFIESPSRTFKQLQVSKGAVVIPNEINNTP